MRDRLGDVGTTPFCVKHLNPRQGITTTMARFVFNQPKNGVKHLNPRQGITTLAERTIHPRCPTIPSVKHLNPRQGITTTGHEVYLSRFSGRV